MEINEALKADTIEERTQELKRDHVSIGIHCTDLSGKDNNNKTKNNDNNQEKSSESSSRRSVISELVGRSAGRRRQQARMSSARK